MTLSIAAVAAKRANAAYFENAADSSAAFSSIGDSWVSMYKDSSHQAVLSVDCDKNTWLSISGTRISGIHLLDVFRDVSIIPKKVKGGIVTEGVHEGMSELWSWARQIAPYGTVFNVCGHSLGASRTHLTPLFLPAAQIGKMFSFEAPKFCNADFYQTYKAELSNMLCFLNGHDLWAAWPWENPEWCDRPDSFHVWLKGDTGEYEMIKGEDWRGGMSAQDHDMDLVQSRVIALDNTLFKSETK